RSSGLFDGFESTYGAMISKNMPMPGMVTPATIGWNIVSSSCRPRKYHGAFDGFGVWFTSARPSSGARTIAEKMRTIAVIASAAVSAGVSAGVAAAGASAAGASSSPSPPRPSCLRRSALRFRRCSGTSAIGHSLPGLQRSTDAAVLADAPEVDRHEDDDDERE